MPSEKEILIFEGEDAECRTPDEGLRLYYSADGTPNNLIGGPNLMSVGGVGYGPGRIGQAFVLDGHSSYLLMNEKSNYHFSIDGSSLALYVKFTELNGEMTIVDATSWARLNTAPAPYVRLFKTTDQHLGFDLAMTGENRVHLLSKTVVKVNRWYHVGFTTEKNKLAMLYVDGVIEDQRIIPESHGKFMIGVLPPLYLGATNGNSNFLHGKLDEILFYDHALRANEIKHLYEMHESGPCRASLVQ